MNNIHLHIIGSQTFVSILDELDFNYDISCDKKLKYNNKDLFVMEEQEDLPEYFYNKYVSIPDAIQSAIYEAIDREWEGAVDNIEVLLDKDKILEGTDWLKGSSAPASIDPFANMEIPEEPIKKVEGKKSQDSNPPKTKKLSDLF